MPGQESKKPSLRCPNCGLEVFMPTEECFCGYNFRLGRKPEPVSGSRPGPEVAPSHTKLFIIAGAAAVAIVLAFLVFFLSSPGSEPELGPQPVGGGGSPMTVETILTESPVLNPARTINRAQGVADLADKRVEELKEISKDYNEN
jgi:hypothetical protein